MHSSKTNGRQVREPPKNYINILYKYPSELLSKISTAINTTKSSSKTKPSQKSKNSSSKVAPIGGGRKRTKTKKRRATK